MSAELYNTVIAALPKVAFVVAVMAVIVVVLEGLLVQDRFESRMKALLTERERIRQRERGNIPNKANSNAFKQLLGTLANRAKLAIWLLDEPTQQALARAGFRDSAARDLFLIFRIAAIVGFGLLYSLYCIVQGDFAYLAGVPAASWVGLRLSSYTLEKIAEKRNEELTGVAPDIIDLLTICVEAGMSIEISLQRVADEIGRQSKVAGDELNVLAAELAYVQKRSDAFSNLAARTGAKSIQDLCISLIQADTYGTSIAATLRLQSIESRKLRQLEAERQALSIPPKLSIVMVFFFMPVIMIVMLYPAISKMTGMSLPF